MSVKTWQEEFYPVEHDVPEALQNPIAHSLQKWKGFRKENLDKHQVFWDGAFHIRPTIFNHFDGLSTHCALCEVAEIRHAACSNRINDDDYCRSCPLFETLGNRSCDGTVSDDAPFLDSPWHIATTKHDPEPMIQALEKCLAENPGDAPL